MLILPDDWVVDLNHFRSQGTGNDDAVALEEYAIVNCEFSEVPVISDGYGNQFFYVAPSKCNRYGIVYITRYCSASPETVLTFHW